MEISAVVLMTIFIISCAGQNKNTFSLTGKTRGMKNGTILLLENAQNGEIIDSVTVEKNSFKFKNPPTTFPLQVYLCTKDHSECRAIWLENRKMTFDATSSNFQNALVSGSGTENVAQEMRRKIYAIHGPQRKIMEMEFVKSHPDNIVSAYILSVYSTTWGKEKTSELFKNFPEKLKETEYGKNISDYIRLNRNPKVGDRFVDFEMKDSTGKLRKISEFKGKLLLLEFWASGCGPCRANNPGLVRTYQKYSPFGFEIVGVSLDKNRKNWLEAVRKDRLTWLQLNDLKGFSNKAGLIYGILGIPDNFLIDKNGIIIGRNLRGEKLTEKLSELLPAADKER
ncbi:MAG: AhpC/TSA family protein [Acidobacteria bacterium]|nr:AhpC/TSA family protein [Acidobacteriota bacterium]